MKKIALVLSLAFLVFSCSKDDDGDDSGASISRTDVLGTWQLVSKTYNEESIELDVCELQSTLQFTETRFERINKQSSFTVDGECMDSNNVIGEYSFEGNELYVDQEFEDGLIEEVYESDVSVSGNVLTFSDIYVDDDDTDDFDYSYSNILTYELVVQ